MITLLMRFATRPLKALLMRLWRPLAVATIATGIYAVPLEAPGVELLGSKCEFTPQELADPDQVLALTLTGERFCAGISVGEDLYGTVVLPKVGRWPQVHPEKAIARLLDRYGVPKNEPFEPWGGVFREFKVLDKRSRTAVGGYEAIEYTVELLYVRLTGWQHVPKTGRYGIVPVCERNVVRIVAIDYQGAWWINRPLGIGSSATSSAAATKRRNWDRQHIDRDIAERSRIEDRCKDHLN